MNMFQLSMQKLNEYQPTVPQRSWHDVRRSRNTLLTKSDWSQTADNGLTESQKEAWREYRQALRDITNQDINNITWPEKPE